MEAAGRRSSMPTVERWGVADRKSSQLNERLQAGETGCHTFEILYRFGTVLRFVRFKNTAFSQGFLRIGEYV